MERIREQLRLTPDRVRDGGLSRLETVAVGGHASNDYSNKVELFEGFCARHALSTETEADLDMALFQYFDEKYLENQTIDFGTKTLAAIGHKFPQYYRCSKSGRLPRARRALAAWGKVAPPLARLPLPFPLICALAMEAMAMGFEMLALFLVTATDAYLRPGEALSIKAQDVIAGHPQLGGEFAFVSLLLAPFEDRQPTETGDYNDSVIFNTGGREWIGELLLKHAQTFAPDQKIFQISAHELRRQLTEVTQNLKLEAWKIVLYQCRHSGPSQDCIAKLRDLTEIQKRGRWRTKSSVRRYEKAARVTSQLAKLPKSLQLHCTMCVERLQKVMSGRAEPIQFRPCHHR